MHIRCLIVPSFILKVDYVEQAKKLILIDSKND